MKSVKPLKPLKAAAVLAGSVLALGAAAPAFAGENLPMSLNGGLGEAAQTVTNQERLDPTVVNTNALDRKNDGSLVNSLGDVANGLTGGAKGGKGGAMLGGIPLGK